MINERIEYLKEQLEYLRNDKLITEDMFIVGNEIISRELQWLEQLREKMKQSEINAKKLKNSIPNKGDKVPAYYIGQYELLNELLGDEIK